MSIHSCLDKFRIDSSLIELYRIELKIHSCLDKFRSDLYRLPETVVDNYNSFVYNSFSLLLDKFSI